MRYKIIQVPVDRDLLEALNKVSRRQAKSRSALIREACAKYLATAEKEERIRQYVEGYRRMPETEDELDFAESSAGSLAELIEDEAWNEE